MAFGAKIDEFIGVNGAAGYLIIILLAYLSYQWINRSEQMIKAQQGEHDSDEEEEAEPPRNFTVKQLSKKDGKKDPDDQDTPVYLSLNRIVFDVSKGRDFYGPGGPYELFAGRECGVALAKMSFDETYLDDIAGCDKLDFGEKEELDNWLAKFEHYRSYPIMGNLVPDCDLPQSDKVLTKEDIAKFDGKGEVPDGYATAPIYVGVGEKVYDASFGGVTFYGKGCSYERFAGKDASRALAKMSFDPKDTENTAVDDLNENEIKIMNDWAKTYEEKKGYPIVGVIKK